MVKVKMYVKLLCFMGEYFLHYRDKFKIYVKFTQYQLWNITVHFDFGWPCFGQKLPCFNSAFILIEPFMTKCNTFVCVVLNEPIFYIEENYVIGQRVLHLHLILCMHLTFCLCRQNIGNIVHNMSIHIQLQKNLT